MGDQAMIAAQIDAAPTTQIQRQREINVVLNAAQPLLDLGSRIRLRGSEEALEPLRDRLRAMVEVFDSVVRHSGIDEFVRMAVRYCLCTFVDEIVAATPSGGAGAWASRSLLLQFHGETSGGERFFSFLHDLSRDARAHLDALELIYVMLALGMEGRYRLVEGGRSQLDAIRDQLRALVIAERGTPPAWPRTVRDGAQAWRGRGRCGLSGLIVIGSLIAFVSLVVILEARLHAQARSVIETLARLRVVSKPSAEPLQPATDVLAAMLARRLADDLSAGRIALEGGRNRAVLTLGSDSVFASGSAVVLPDRIALLRRVGAALRDLDARIVVAGHTDDTPPSRGKRSNWQLSLARATEVVNLLREDAGAPERFLAQGRGASEPVSPNDSPANRARNRRVVITIIAGGGSL